MPIPAGTSAAGVTLQEFKDHLNLPANTSESDSELQTHLDAALRAVEKRIGPTVHTAVSERVTASGNGRLVLNQTPLVSVTTLTSVPGGVPRDVTGLRVDSAAGIVSAAAGRLAAGEYDVEYVAGHSDTILPDHKLAVLYVAEHLWEMQQQTGVGARPGLFGEEPPGGEESARYIYRGFALPRRALELLSGDEQIGIG